MNSSKTSLEILPSAAPTHVLIADGGRPSFVSTERDPFVALEDLMVVVAALCPVWPSRPTFAGMPPSRL